MAQLSYKPSAEPGPHSATRPGLRRSEFVFFMTNFSPLDLIFKRCDLETDFGWDRKESTLSTSGVNYPINIRPIDPQFHQILAINPSSALCHRRTAMPQPRPNQLRIGLLQALSPSLVPSSSPEEHRRSLSMIAGPARDTPLSTAIVAACHSLKVRKTVSPHCPNDVSGSPVEN
jgi:hypothetical protein